MKLPLPLGLSHILLLLAALACITEVSAVLAEAVENLASDTLNDNADLTESKIYNGDITKQSFPFFVAIMAKSKNDTDVAESYFIYCAGSLITPTKVLTAAHCAKGMDFKNQTFQAWFHPTTLTKKPEQIIDIISPGSYPSNFNKRGRLENDIGIYTLHKPANLTKGVSLICISDLKNYTNLNVKLVGFGRYDCFNTSQVLRSSAGNTSDAKTCKKVPNFQAKNEICARLRTKSGKMAEQAGGDSGGPLFMDFGKGKFEQVGLVSYNLVKNGTINPETKEQTNPCPDPKYPGVYTIPAAHKTFLMMNAPGFKTCVKNQ